jgi:hypothetical protein
VYRSPTSYHHSHNTCHDSSVLLRLPCTTTSNTGSFGYRGGRGITIVVDVTVAADRVVFIRRQWRPSMRSPLPGGRAISSCRSSSIKPQLPFSAAATGAIQYCLVHFYLHRYCTTTIPLHHHHYTTATRRRHHLRSTSRARSFYSSSIWRLVCACPALLSTDAVLCSLWCAIARVLLLVV